MPDTGPVSNDNLSHLYSSGKSMAEIAVVLKCSPNKVVYWMKKYNIKRRIRSEAIYLKHNPHGDPFKIRSHLSSEEQFLKGLGLGIYWGEGTKTTKHALRVANTDPDLLLNFIKFLTKICHLEKHRFSYSIVCFNDTKPEIAKNYWAKKLKISPSKFGKITQIPKQGKGSYRRKSIYGVCSVQANNVKLKNWLMDETEKLKDK